MIFTRHECALILTALDDAREYRNGGRGDVEWNAVERKVEALQKLEESYSAVAQVSSVIDRVGWHVDAMQRLLRGGR